MDKVVDQFASDTEFYNWLKSNPNGLVLNTRQGFAPNYVVLHRSSCRTLQNHGGRKGGYTERDYRKACSNSEVALKGWVVERLRDDGQFSKRCGICFP